MTDPGRISAGGHILRMRLRKGLQGLHAAFGLLLLAALWIMVNYLSARNFRREDWSRQRLTEFSEKTSRVLEGLEVPVTLTVFTGKEFRGLDELEDLLKEYARRSRRLTLRWVDPDRDLPEAKEILGKFGVAEADQLIVEGGGRHTVVPLAPMLVMEGDDTRKLGQTPKVVGFQGEAHVTAALLKISSKDTPTVYFLAGHGEKDPDNFENVSEGYSEVRERLERDNLLVRRLLLEEAGGIPDDAAALVVAGPRTRISQPELDLLRGYLESNGRVLFLVDILQDAGLEPLLREWGVHLLPDMVVDPTRTLRGMDLHVTDYGDHAITRSLRGIRSIFLRPRSVLPVDLPANSADRPRYTALAASTSQGWAELDLETQPVTFDPANDQQGPIPVAAAVEWAFPGAQNPRNPQGRIVVVGDSEFAGNWLRNGGGMQLLVNSVHWLLDSGDLLAIPAKEVEEIRLQMDQHSLNRLLLQVALLLPGAAAAVGLLVFARRRA